MNAKQPFLLAAVLLVFLGSCSASDNPQKQQLSIATADKALHLRQTLSPGTRAKVENLLGSVEIKPGDKALKVDAMILAGGDSKAQAEELASRIRLDTLERDGKLTIKVHYPLDQSTSYRLLPNPDDSEDNIEAAGFDSSGSTSRSSFRYHDQKVTVYRGGSTGTPLRVNLVIHMPPGIELEVENHAGSVYAHDLTGRLNIDSDVGRIHVRDSHGLVEIDAGNGDLRLADVEGELDIDIGAGDLRMERVQASGSIELGAGDIDAIRLQARELEIDTGTGDLQFRKLHGALQTETGTGDINVDSLGKLTDLRAETGVGDIALHGDLSGLRNLNLETGTGDVTLTSHQLPALSLDIHASNIDVQWPGLRNIQQSGNHFQADIGAATGDAEIHSGLGDVTLESSP